MQQKKAFAMKSFSSIIIKRSDVSKAFHTVLANSGGYYDKLRFETNNAIIVCCQHSLLFQPKDLETR